jgi:hypothetical protein
MAGPQSGIRETFNGIPAFSIAKGSPCTIQLYSSPIDCTFAYSDNVQEHGAG